MSVFVDDKQVDLPGEDLASLLEAARSHLTDSERVVVEVSLDGEELTGQQLENQAQIAVAGREVRFYTADPRALAAETLGQVRQQLQQLDGLQQEAAELLQQDQARAGLQQVGQAVEVWLQTQQAVEHSAQLLGLDLSAMEVDGQSVSQITQNLAEQLKRLKEQLSEGDTVALADALAYEWPETIQQWDRLLETLIERIEAS